MNVTTADYHSVERAVRAWLTNAPPAQREMMVGVIQTAPPLRDTAESSREIWDLVADCSKFGAANAGRHLLYAWVDKNNEVYYIGKGDSNRPTNVYSRSPQFKKRHSEDDFVYIIAKFLNDECATGLEMACIRRAAELGYPLVNQKGVPEQDSIQEQAFRLIAKCKKTADIQKELYLDSRQMNKFEQRYREYARFHKMAEKYGVFEALEALPATKLPKCSITKHEMIAGYKDIGRKFGSSPTFWKLNGQIRPAKEVCSDYGISYSTVTRRMDRWGLTLEQALTLPRVPIEHRKDPVAFWG